MPETDNEMATFDRQRARLARREDSGDSMTSRPQEVTDEQRARIAEMRNRKVSRRLLDD